MTTGQAQDLLYFAHILDPCQGAEALQELICAGTRKH